MTHDPQAGVAYPERPESRPGPAAGGPDEPASQPPTAAQAEAGATGPAAGKYAEYFRTDHLMADLKGRTVRGGAVTVTAQALKFVLQMGGTMVLARLLTPADFGLVAMVTAITGFVAMFKDAGLSMATVQRAEITHEQVSTLFWINVGLSVVLMLVVVALAPAVAWFYGQPELLWVTIALAVPLVFGGLAVQHQALLQRQMRFKSLALTEVAAMALGLLVAIGMAFYMRSYWALVAQPAAMALGVCVILWAVCSWRPGQPHRRSCAWPMLKFGGNLTAFNIINYVTRNLDNVLIGAVLGPQPLGLYNKAYNLLLLPIRQINGPASAVAVPSLSRLQRDPEKYRRSLRRMTELIAFMGMPIVGFAFVDADLLVLTILGDQWNDAVPIFRWLAPAALLGTLNVVPGWLCTTLGNPDRMVHWAIVSAPIVITGFAIGLQWGATGVAIAFSITWAPLLLAFVYYATWRTPVRLSDLFSAVGPTALATVVAVAGMLAVRNYLHIDIHFLVRLLIHLVMFAGIFIGSFAIFPSGRKRLWAMSELSQALKRGSA